jgi:FtsZ-binding cell division protein ZapB
MLASAKRAREAREKMEHALDEQWLSLREFNRLGWNTSRGATAYIATLEAEIEELKAENVSLRECWDEAEGEIADLKAEVPSRRLSHARRPLSGAR